MPVTVAEREREREGELNRMPPVGSSYLTPEYSSADVTVPSLLLVMLQKISSISQPWRCTVVQKLNRHTL